MKGLKECPFCGSNDLNSYHVNEIWCRNCDGGVHLGDHGNKTRKLTHDSWNTRTSIPISNIQELIEKCNKAIDAGASVDSNTMSYEMFRDDLQKLIDEANNG